jgi:hypothetical protein
MYRLCDGMIHMSAPVPVPFVDFKTKAVGLYEFHSLYT